MHNFEEHTCKEFEIVKSLPRIKQLQQIICFFQLTKLLNLNVFQVFLNPVNTITQFVQ